MAIRAGADVMAGGRRGGHRPLGLLRRTVREIGLAMITGGVVVLAFATYQLFGTTLTEQKAQTRLQHSFTSALAQTQRAAERASTTTTSTSRSQGSSGSRGSDGRGHRAASGKKAQKAKKAKKAPGGDSPTVVSSGSLSPSAPPGTAVDHLVIPAIGVNKYVVQGTAANDLSEGPGHYIGTPLPGQVGNAAIAGHRTTYGAPFYRLNKLSIGARIYLTATSGRIFVYRVVATEVVSPTDVAVLDPTKKAVLTLTTCNPPFSATSRLVVVADLVGRALAPVVTTATTAPATTTTRSKAPARSEAPTSTTAKNATPTTVAPAATTPASAAADNLGSGNSNGWPPALAYGAAFVVLWIGTRLVINRTRRGARLAAVVIGIAVCALPLWFCFENVVRLLPANI